MRSKSVIYLIGAVLCASAMAAEQSAGSMSGDILVITVGEPAELSALAAPVPTGPPTVWVPAENIVATWESVTAMSKLYNPVDLPGAKGPERSLSLAARVDVVDVNGLLGFDYTAQGTLVLDEKPRVVYSKAVPSKYCRFYWPLRYTRTMSAGQWVSELQPYNLTVDVPLDPNRPYPTLLSRAEWSLYALVNTQTKTVDVPSSLTADWLTLVPGLEIKVEQATAENGRYQYRLATRYSHSKVLWATSGAAIMIWTGDPTPEVIVTKLDILDAHGTSLTDGASGSSTTGGSTTPGSATRGSTTGGSSTAASGAGSSVSAGSSSTGSSTGGSSTGGSGDLVTGTTSGSGSYSGGGTATKLRFTLALKPRQQQLRFILENVPVPSL